MPADGLTTRCANRTLPCFLYPKGVGAPAYDVRSFHSAQLSATTILWCPCNKAKSCILSGSVAASMALTHSGFEEQ